MLNNAGRKSEYDNDINAYSNIEHKEVREAACRARQGMLYFVAKRAVDVLIASFALVVLSPILLLVMALIAIDDGFPVIFAHPRIGRGGRVFMCYKFRSMRKAAPPNIATRDFIDADSYITKFGRYLRRMSIDELPQLFNIVRGDMSIVGPRPIIVQEKKLHKMRNMAGVYRVRPGLTGLAQISGRDALDDAKKVVYDACYVQNMCFTFDMLIIIKTVARVLTGEGINEGGVAKRMAQYMCDNRNIDDTM